MKKRLRLLTLALLCHATSALATPILSADGSTLTGVDVGGTLYDVFFGDGIVGDVYAGVTFDAAREAEANAVSAAIVSALNGIGGITPDAINGCEDVDLCFLFNPDSIEGSTYVHNGLLYQAAFVAPGTWFLEGGKFGLGDTEDTAAFSIYSTVTYRMQSATVPAPATLLLFGLGLAGLGISRWKRQTNR